MKTKKKIDKKYHAPVFVEGAGVLTVSSSDLLHSFNIQQQLRQMEKLREYLRWNNL